MVTNMTPGEVGARVVDKRKNWEARVEMAVFKLPKSELSAYDKLVYAILCGHANRDGNAMLYVRTVAEEASCSERQAQRALSNLEAHGLLVRKPQNSNGRQTFNIYEVYGFDAYIPCESSEEPASEPDSGNNSTSADQGVQDSHPCRSDTPRPSEGHPRGDCEAGFNNVFKQPLKNSLKDNNSPPTPQGDVAASEGNGEYRETAASKPQNPEHDTAEKTNTPKRLTEAEAYEAIRNAYNAILPELPQAGKITDSRAKILRERILEDTERGKLGWWKNFFLKVRDFPWPMGSNLNTWRADFDWLIGEKGMRKILEGSFSAFSVFRTSHQQAPAFGGATAADLELQRKYTNAEGLVNAKAILRDSEIQRAASYR
jgi:predicted transcriptional regulator